MSPPHPPHPQLSSAHSPLRGSLGLFLLLASLVLCLTAVTAFVFYRIYLPTRTPTLASPLVEHKLEPPTPTTCLPKRPTRRFHFFSPRPEVPSIVVSVCSPPPQQSDPLPAPLVQLPTLNSPNIIMDSLQVPNKSSAGVTPLHVVSNIPSLSRTTQEVVAVPAQAHTVHAVRRVSLKRPSKVKRQLNSFSSTGKENIAPLAPLSSRSSHSLSSARPSPLTLPQLEPNSEF